MSYIFALVRDLLGDQALSRLFEDLYDLEKTLLKDDDGLDTPLENRKHFHITVHFSCHSSVFCTVGGSRCPRDGNRLRQIRGLIVNVDALYNCKPGYCPTCLKNMEHEQTNDIDDAGLNYEWSIDLPFKSQPKGANVLIELDKIYNFIRRLRQTLAQDHLTPFMACERTDQAGAGAKTIALHYDGQIVSEAAEPAQNNHGPCVLEQWNANNLILACAWSKAGKSQERQ